MAQGIRLHLTWTSQSQKGFSRKGAKTQKISAAIRDHSVAGLGDEARLIVLHDRCDIRKEYAEVLEKLGKVRDLAGNLNNGYSTFNSVAVDVTGKKLYPVDLAMYSNGDEHYVTVAELKALAQGKLQQVDWQRAEQIEQFIQEDSVISCKDYCISK